MHRQVQSFRYVSTILGPDQLSNKATKWMIAYIYIYSKVFHARLIVICAYIARVDAFELPCMIQICKMHCTHSVAFRSVPS